MNPTARRNAREYAIQALYQWQVADAPITDIEAEFLAHQIIKKKVDIDYFKELIHTIVKQQSDIDAYMLPFLDRPIQELDPVELAILRLGIYELVNRLDIPYRVVINEGLELTKRFGSIEGFKFVNGILDKVAHKLRLPEIAAHKK